MQLILQCFTLQLVQIVLFANVLPLQNFPVYGLISTIIHMYIHFFLGGCYQLRITV